MKKVEIYTDGSCKGNPGPGGWGAVLKYQDTIKDFSGREKETTNNRMELTAVIEALNLLKSKCEVDIYTDSKYVQNGITSWIHNWKKNGWKTAAKKPVKNADLWEKLDNTVQKHQVNWHWVKGHAGHEMNERADYLASN